MKARFKHSHTLCEDYPDCECKGHFVYEKNKKRFFGDEK